jgi:hypothetical protein
MHFLSHIFSGPCFRLPELAKDPGLNDASDIRRIELECLSFVEREISRWFCLEPIPIGSTSLKFRIFVARTWNCERDVLSVRRKRNCMFAVENCRFQTVKREDFCLLAILIGIGS